LTGVGSSVAAGASKLRSAPANLPSRTFISSMVWGDALFASGQAGGRSGIRGRLRARL